MLRSENGVQSTRRWIADASQLLRRDARVVWLWAPPRARERVLCFAATSWCSCPRSCLQLFVMMRVFATIVMIHEAYDLAKVRYLHVLCLKFFHLSNRKMKLQLRAPNLHSLCCAEYRTIRFPRARVRAPGALATSCLTETHPWRVVRVLIAWHCNVARCVVRPERNSAAEVACKKAFSASLGWGTPSSVPADPTRSAFASGALPLCDSVPSRQQVCWWNATPRVSLP